MAQSIGTVKVRPETKQCELCAAAFVGGRADGRYCGATCRRAAHRVRERAARAVIVELRVCSGRSCPRSDCRRRAQDDFDPPVVADEVAVPCNLLSWYICHVGVSHSSVPRSTLPIASTRTGGPLSRKRAGRPRQRLFRGHHPTIPLCQPCVSRRVETWPTKSTHSPLVWLCTLQCPTMESHG